jgi:WD40 repeat protein
VFSVVFSPDGKTLLSGSTDFTARLWVVRPLVRLGPPLQHEGAVTAVDISSDGRMLLTASHDKTVRLWKMPVPLVGDARRISLWVQSLTAMTLDEAGNVHILDDDAWESCRGKLEAAGGPPRSGAEQ